MDICYFILKIFFFFLSLLKTVNIYSSKVLKTIPRRGNKTRENNLSFTFSELKNINPFQSYESLNLSKKLHC